MSRRSPFALAACLALLVVPLIVVPAAAAPSAAALEHARILAYWTPARMAAARPLDITPVGAGGVKGKPPGTPGGGGGGGGGDTGNVTGASWTNGGPVVAQTGKVWFHMPSGNYICSGSVITDSRSGYSTVLTAGHCAYDASTGFVTEWMFIPNFDANPTYTCANTTYGCWTATALVIHYGFRYAGSFNTQAITHDWAFAVVGAGGKTGTAQLDATVGGSYGITLGASSTRLEAFGYPAANPYNGSDLTWCAGPAATDASTSSGSTWGMGCNMTGGASGGPWFIGLDETNGTGGSVASLNSYKYTNDSSHMYGPIFNSRTQATLTLALSTTSGNQVAGTAP
jgi:V8-like Glu-specific endopeptidase